MNYKKDIINKLLDKYEEKRGYDATITPTPMIQIDFRKSYPEYFKSEDADTYQEIDAIINQLVDGGYITVKKDKYNVYTKLILNIDKVNDCYIETKRVSIPKKCEFMLEALSFTTDNALLKTIINDYKYKILKYEQLPHGIKYDTNRLKEILKILDAILKLNQETYIRNFSTVLFQDSKKFQADFEKTIENILYDYTNDVKKKDILGYYNLCNNPTYVYIKGDAKVIFNTSIINVIELPDGIAFSSKSLDKIEKIVINTSRVITVENLTTYYDSNEKDAVYIYLGGYHNSPKQRLLEKIYRDNKNKKYLHEGDLDVHGFLILENLKKKTNIPFVAYKMDVNTLKQFYEANLYKPLEPYDIKTINDKKELLKMYSDVLDYMIEHNCKVEQESFEAIKLMQ